VAGASDIREITAVAVCVAWGVGSNRVGTGVGLAGAAVGLAVADPVGEGVGGFAVGVCGNDGITGTRVDVGNNVVGVRDGSGVHGGGVPPGLAPEASGIISPTARARLIVTTARMIFEDRSSRCIQYLSGSEGEN
jgi:hypothetical protein